MKHTATATSQFSQRSMKFYFMDKLCLILNAEEFKNDLSELISHKIKEAHIQPHKWLRSSQVCDMLNISPSVLQQARINCDLPAVQLSTGTWLYPYQGVIDALEAKTTGRRQVNHD